ncbi:hypothetical protein PoB_004352200 [Plakobranchus ocellatus]|uniref:Uncharacterized protein n=1 Tax=Plakobranchus ocellatus TaxID=259542 RepID=A0AAV4BC47_9GAST|nr:hypothetical protein PoB_004352200 [Plakobranchus ocellatus]
MPDDDNNDPDYAPSTINTSDLTDNDSFTATENGFPTVKTRSPVSRTSTSHDTVTNDPAPRPGTSHDIDTNDPAPRPGTSHDTVTNDPAPRPDTSHETDNNGHVASINSINKA